jgi:hypothetical protein
VAIKTIIARKIIFSYKNTHTKRNSTANTPGSKIMVPVTSGAALVHLKSSYNKSKV